MTPTLTCSGENVSGIDFTVLVQVCVRTAGTEEGHVTTRAHHLSSLRSPTLVDDGVGEM